MLSELTVGEVISMLETMRNARLAVAKLLTGNTATTKEEFPFLRPNSDYDFAKIEEVLRNLKIDQNQ